MSSRTAPSSLTRTALPLIQAAGLALLLGLTLAATVTTLSAVAGWLPWLQIDAAFGETALPAAGQSVQIGLTLVLLALAAYAPLHGRVMRLEGSHRRFHMSMEDVARAYHAAHAADRTGTFRLSSQFDEVRDRIAFLRDHPDLGGLEPGILESAAQMSQVSHELAETYSDEKVERARTFLRQRQEEVALFNERLDQAKIAMQEIRGWRDAVEMEEAVAESQLNRLKAELNDLLPELQMGMAGLERPGNVVGMAKAAE
ncbi:DNA repair protein [Maritimibacter alkaliphilus]|uniref:DNA repair protein n=1 Tax=Maritimibacter alkaliphilus TaxID=404236 RepID=UPI0021BD02BE|nr:DNA repair protein [Maritimibacter alkaliphilus]